MLSVLIAENNVGMLAHQLDDERLMAKITHLIQMFNCDIDNAFHVWLGYINNSSTCNVLAQYHTESRRLQRAGLVLVCQVKKRKGGTGRHRHPVLPILSLAGKQQLVVFRLCDLTDFTI